LKNRVRECREEQRLTQQELAFQLGVSRQTVISIERGKYDPSLGLAFRLSDALGQSIEALFDPPREGQ
jgi:putative transcriptional regulator